MTTERPPQTRDALHAWIARVLNTNIARTPLIEGHSAPFDYLCHTYFEGQIPPRPPLDPTIPHPSIPSSPDCTVWAARGGGKTFLGAIATLLDLVFKPGIQVRILGGSLEQSQRMHEHLRRLCEIDEIADRLDAKPTSKRIRLKTGSTAEVLAASQTSVRGTRVQKLRCDEVDLFDPDVWAAAQLATRSMPCDGPWGKTVRGSVEALSTMHRPFGLMWKLVLGRERTRSVSDGPPLPSSYHRHLFRWGVVDVLEPCGPEHTCDSCTLFPECSGKAKSLAAGSAGHISISDAVAMKSRVDGATWAAEMLCRRPRRTDTVYPEFDPDLHVYDVPQAVAAPATACADSPQPAAPHPDRLYIAGMDFGIRSEGVVLLASIDADNVLRIEREHAAPGLTLARHIDILQGWIDQGQAGLGIAWLGIDPAGRNRSDQTGVSNASILNDAGFRIRSRRSEVDEGLRLVRARLLPAAAWASSPSRRVLLTLNREPPGPGEPQAPPADAPRLLIHSRCKRLLECVERYHYPPDRPESPEPVKDGHDHACDALRYLVINLDRPGTPGVREY